MLQLIVGKKGTGKTKTLIGMILESAKICEGDIVCIEKGANLIFDIPHQVRLVDAEQSYIKGFEAFYGFLAGLIAGNYDIKEIYVDSILKISGGLDGFEALLEKLQRLLGDDVKLTFTVSADLSELPASLQQYVYQA